MTALETAYPRSRGGTLAAIVAVYAFKGLSPLTRGNRFFNRSGAAFLGPIPAHAGEPQHCAWLIPAPWAYPRSRGGTGHGETKATALWGLSPLTRGNRPIEAVTTIELGPIPAHAGEPEPFR